jgi:hypothetical protein
MSDRRITADEWELIREIVRGVVREIEAERQERLHARLELARKARGVKREAKAAEPKGPPPLPRSCLSALGVLRNMEEATPWAWKDELVAVTGLSQEAARKCIARAIHRLLERGMIECVGNRTFRPVHPVL